MVLSVYMALALSLGVVESKWPRGSAVGALHPWAERLDEAVQSVAVSDLFCICKFVFPLHPLVNCGFLHHPGILRFI